MARVLLKEKVNLEPYAEDNDARDPIRVIVDGASSVRGAVTGVLNHLEQLREEFPAYFDFEYISKGRGYGYGARSEWFELWGTPLEDIFKFKGDK